MLTWYLLSKPLIALKCKATTDNLKPHVWKQYRFIVSTDVFFYFRLNTTYLSICQCTLVLLQTGTFSRTNPTTAVELNQINIFLDERDLI